MNTPAVVAKEKKPARMSVWIDERLTARLEAVSAVSGVSVLDLREELQNESNRVLAERWKGLELEDVAAGIVTRRLQEAQDAATRKLAQLKGQS